MFCILTQVCEIWVHGNLGDDAVNVHRRDRSHVEVRTVHVFY